MISFQNISCKTSELLQWQRDTPGLVLLPPANLIIIKQDGMVWCQFVTMDGQDKLAFVTVTDVPDRDKAKT